ncbi:cohesin domain-containing protein [Massilia sp. CMS3.1]|uniref:cohesin domain-containing protein n=1 Tax=Massilia sp. CMS3.1 TaxID=3373083 RepID=UPI003EE512F0
MIKWKTCLAAALLAASSQSWAAPILTAEATPNPATLGSAVDVDVRIADIADLYAYGFTVNYNANLLRAINITEGAFLGSAGTTYSYGGDIDNTAGTISFIFNSLIGPIPGASGSGSLAQVRFEAIGNGSAALSFSDLVFLDSALADIAVDTGTLQVGVVPEPASYMLFGIGLIGAAALRRRSQAVRG